MSKTFNNIRNCRYKGWYFFIFLFILIFVSCEKKSTEEPKVVYFDDYGISNDYTISGFKWEKTTLNFYFGSTFPKNEEYIKAVKAALKSWDDVIAISFVETTVKEDADITIEWGGEYHVNCPVPFPDGVLAHGCPPDFEEYGDFAGDLHFYNKWEWKTNGDKYDIQTVALHEFGHVLGLSHSTDRDNVMFYQYQYRRVLSQDDVNGIRELYGNPVEPSVKTNNVTGITGNSAVSGGTLVSDGGSPITEKGVCWNIMSNPTLQNSSTNEGSGIDGFSSSITNLKSNTTYYLRAYAKNKIGIGYGNEMIFTTIGEEQTLPVVTTNSISNITQNSASGGGNVISDGGSSVYSKGICWSTAQNPTIMNDHSIDGIGIGNFNSTLSGLSPSNTYYIRAYATNSIGTAYGDQVNFTTDDPSDLTVGVKYQGGIIAYILQPWDPGYISGKTHGIIAAPSDQAIEIQWGCKETLVGGTSQDLGTGAQNTIKIVEVCGSGNAASICSDLVLNGYSDWYLPSLSELIRLHNNKSLIGGFAVDTPGKVAVYASSTEYDIYSFWCVRFDCDRSTISNCDQIITKWFPVFHVRAIRSF